MDIEQKVRGIIADKLGVSLNEVASDKSMTDLGADSLDTVELILEFETEFKFSIPDEKAEKIKTVGDAIEYVKNNHKQ